MSRNHYGYGRNNNRADTGLAMYLNPFTSKNSTPKIPDGKCLLSTGLREQLTYQIDAPEAGNVNAFILTPSFHKGFLVYRNFTFNESNPTAVININDLQDLLNTPVGGSPTGHLTTSVNQAQNAFSTKFANFTTSKSNIERVRLVSAGMKLMCTSNSGSNDGWFRATRFVMNSNGADETIDLKQLVNEPSYVTGKIRDLNKYIFQLKPTDTDHDFTEPTGNTFGPHTHDKNYDSILLLLNQGTTTEVVAHTTHNFEIIFNQDEIMSKFHTGCPKDLVGLDKAQSKLMSNVKAATRMSY